LADLKITWNTIPVRAPNFGGAWEVLIREVKRHFIKMTRSRRLTLYEFQCLLCQIKAVGNSRPLGIAESCKGDSEFLTPKHFLSGRKYQQSDIREHIENLKSRYRLIQEMTKQF
jgi:hypothetical protein